MAKEASTKKWTMVVAIPLALTLVIYSATDRTKLQGYLTPGSAPLSNWGAGSFGTVDFSELSASSASSRQLWFYVVRLFLSIGINVSSILLVLIDAVCLEV